MATGFGNSKGIILIDYKPHDTSITGVIKQLLKFVINEKRREKLAADVLMIMPTRITACTHVQSCTSVCS